MVPVRDTNTPFTSQTLAEIYAWLNWVKDKNVWLKFSLDDLPK